MARSNKLRLTSEIVLPKLNLSEVLPYAEILVDTGLSQTHEIYTYGVPEHLHEACVPGILVQVDFHGVKKRGYVLERMQTSPVTGSIKIIEKILSSTPIYTGELRTLIENCSKRYGALPWSIISRVIPSPIIKVEKGRDNLSLSNARDTEVGFAKSEISREFRYLQPHKPIDEQIIKEVLSTTHSQVLIVAPDGRDLEILSIALSKSHDIKFLNSSIPAGERYKNYLDAQQGKPGIYLGNRSAIFTPLANDHVIFVLNDNDFAHYESHFPGWNTRDVAVLRSAMSSTIFLSTFPSLEIARLISVGWIGVGEARNRHSIKLHTTIHSGSDILNLKESIKGGDVLVLASESGYITAISCEKCRSLARCECGGKLIRSAGTVAPICALCEKEYPEWSCQYCASHQLREFGKGSSRQSYEIGKALPGVLIQSNSKNSPIYRHEKLTSGENSVVVSHLEEIPVGTFAGISIRDTESVISRSGLRAEENALRMFCETLTNLQADGDLIVDLQTTHPLYQSLLRGEFERSLHSLLSERESLRLTPYVRFAILWGDENDLEPIAAAAMKNELFIHVAFEAHGDDSRIIFRSQVEAGDKLGEFFADLSRLRLLKREKPLRYRVDPYEITFTH